MVQKQRYLMNLVCLWSPVKIKFLFSENITLCPPLQSGEHISKQCTRKLLGEPDWDVEGHVPVMDYALHALQKGVIAHTDDPALALLAHWTKKHSNVHIGSQCFDFSVVQCLIHLR